MSLFAALSIAGQALLSNKVALNSTTKNINNAYTDGYSREEAVFEDIPGSGVSVRELRRLFDSALFKQWVAANHQSSSYQEQEVILSQVEAVLNDAQGSGFSKELEAFFNSLNDVAVNPDDLAARNSFLSAAQTLVGRIRQTYSSLEEIEVSSKSQLVESVNSLNRLLSELSGLNRFIPLQKGSFEYNQYLDKRDQLIREISSLIEVKVKFNDDGTVDLFTAKGHPLLLGDRALTVSFDEDKYGIRLWVNGTDLAGELQGGKIGGLLKGIELVREWKERINKFVSAFAGEVNRQHAQGYDLYGEEGEELFVSDNGQPLDASNIALAFTDPKKVAAAASVENLNSDNENAKKLIELSQVKWSELDGLSFSEYYGTQIVSALGAKLSTVKNLRENSAFRVESLESKIGELSGVNLDEELLKLTQYQRAYEAATKVVSVSDELLETILGIVR